MSAPAYRVFQNLLSNSFCIYDERGPVLGYEDIPCRGEAESHILDLIAADERSAFEAVRDELEDALDAIIAETQAHNAALDDHEAQAVAMAYGPALTTRAA